MLQKITLFLIAIFFLIIASIGVLNYVYPPDQTTGGPDIVNNTTATNTAPAGTNSQSGGLTYAEVAKHNTPSNCYLTIKGVVYNVSSYINKHPGGSNAITSNCGKEASGLFASIHSNFAWNLLSGYKIGVIGASQAAATQPSGAIQTATLPSSVKSDKEDEYEDD